MAQLHKKCDECKAMLTPRGEDVPESTLHRSYCSQFKAIEFPKQRDCCATNTGQMHTPGCAVFRAQVTRAQASPQVAYDKGAMEATTACKAGVCVIAPGAVHDVDCPKLTADAMYANIEHLRQSAPRGGTDHILDDTWRSTSGASSSTKAPPFHLIPLEALIAEANRFGGGVVKHGRDNFRQACGTRPGEIRVQAYPEMDWAWIEDRVNHAMLHMLKWLNEIEGYEPETGDDHAGAVMWLGAIMKEFEKGLALRKEARGVARGK